MAAQKQPSRNFRKMRFRACLPDTTGSVEKTSQSISKGYELTHVSSTIPETTTLHTVSK